jgi:hypothetical protein
MIDGLVYVWNEGGLDSPVTYDARIAISGTNVIASGEYELIESKFELKALNIYNNSSITNFNATITNATTTQTIETTNGSIFWNYDDIVNITIEAEDYFDRTFTNYNTSSNLDSEHWQANLTLTATDNLGTSIQEFNCTGEYIFNSTTNGIMSLLLNTGSFVFNCSAPTYEIVQYTSPTLTVLDVETDTVLFGNSTINITFRDEDDNSFYNSSPVELNLIAQTAEFSNNYSTDNGSIYIATLPNNYYNIIYGSSESNLRSVFFYIPPEPGEINMTLYILDIDDTETRTFIVQNENGQRVENVTIEIYKFIVGSIGWTQVGSYLTNTNGVVPVDSEDYSLYRYDLIYKNSLVLTDTEFFVSAVAGDTKTFTIVTADNSIDELRKVGQSFVNVTGNETTKSLILDWYDPDGYAYSACLEVYEISLDYLISTTCSVSSPITYTVNASEDFYIGRGFVNVSGSLYYKQSGFLDLSDKINAGLGRTNFIFIIIGVVLILFFSFVALDWRLGLIMAIPLPLFVFIKIGLLVVTIGVAYYAMITIIIIAILHDKFASRS